MMLALGLGVSGGRPPGAIAGWLAGQERVADWRPELGLMWQTIDTAQPVTATGQSVGRIRAAAGGAAEMPLIRGTALSRPTYGGGDFIFDGGDSWDGQDGTLELSRAAGRVTCAARVWFDSLPTDARLFSCAPGGLAAQTRLGFIVGSAGAVGVQARRLDGDGTTTAFSATGQVTAGGWVSLLWTVDFLTGGAGALSCYINGGGDVIGGALAGSGLSSDTQSARVRIGSNQAGTPGDLLTGKLRRLIFAQGAALPSAAERAAIFAELGA